MKFADQIPNIYAASERNGLSRVCLIPGSTGPSSHHHHLHQPCKPLIRLPQQLMRRVGARYPWLPCKTAQATRANLLAIAILTMPAGRRARSALIHPADTEALPRACRKSVVAPSTRSRRRYRSPCLEMCPSRTLPPVPLCRGTSPIQAAKCRPERKEFGSVMVAASAPAVMMPMPGIVSRRWLSSFVRCQTRISCSTSGSGHGPPQVER